MSQSRFFSCFLFAFALFFLCPVYGDAPNSRKPNFIFVLSDDIAQGDLGCYGQRLIQNDMIRWVRRTADQPFMLFYAITLPHGRHEIDDYGIYRDKPWTEKQKAYAAQVTRVDSDMGELVDTLRELGIAENTLIVFAGDNGSSFSPQSEIGKRFDQASNGLRGFKRSMYEGALRQAALAWWPGTVPAGHVDEQPWVQKRKRRRKSESRMSKRDLGNEDA